MVLHFTARRLDRPLVGLLNAVEFLLAAIGLLGHFLYFVLLADNALTIHIRPQRFVRQSELMAALFSQLGEQGAALPVMYQSDDRTHRILAWGIVGVFVLMSALMQSASGALLLWGLFLAALAPLIWLGPGIDLLVLLGGRRFAHWLTRHEAWIATLGGLGFLAELVLLFGFALGDWF